MRTMHDLRSPNAQIIVWVRCDNGWSPEPFDSRDEADEWIAAGNTHAQFVITNAIIFPKQYPSG